MVKLTPSEINLYNMMNEQQRSKLKRDQASFLAKDGNSVSDTGSSVGELALESQGGTVHDFGQRYLSRGIGRL